MVSSPAIVEGYLQFRAWLLEFSSQCGADVHWSLSLGAKEICGRCHEENTELERGCPEYGRCRVAWDPWGFERNGDCKTYHSTESHH